MFHLYVYYLTTHSGQLVTIDWSVVLGVEGPPENYGQQHKKRTGREDGVLSILREKLSVLASVLHRRISQCFQLGCHLLASSTGSLASALHQSTLHQTLQSSSVDALDFCQRPIALLIWT